MSSLPSKCARNPNSCEQSPSVQAAASPAVTQTFQMSPSPLLEPSGHTNQHQHGREHPSSSRAEVKSTACPEDPHVPSLPVDLTCHCSHLDHVPPATPAWVSLTIQVSSHFSPHTQHFTAWNVLPPKLPISSLPSVCVHWEVSSSET